MAGGLLVGGCGAAPQPEERWGGGRWQEERRGDGGQQVDGGQQDAQPEAPAPSPAPQVEGLDAEERVFLGALNAHRAAHGLAPLQVSVALSQAADFHSVEMAQNDYFSHTLLNGVTWSENLCNHGYCYRTSMAENIAAGNATGSATFTQWKDSPGHNANMLGAGFTVVGIGRASAEESRYGWYWTTTFGGHTDAVMPLETQ